MKKQRNSSINASSIIVRRIFRSAYDAKLHHFVYPNFRKRKLCFFPLSSFVFILYHYRLCLFLIQWLPEIRQRHSDKPIIMVGCKLDLKSDHKPTNIHKRLVQSTQVRKNKENYDVVVVNHAIMTQHYLYALESKQFRDSQSKLNEQIAQKKYKETM